MAFVGKIVNLTGTSQVFPLNVNGVLIYLDFISHEEKPMTLDMLTVVMGTDYDPIIFEVIVGGQPIQPPPPPPPPRRSSWFSGFTYELKTPILVALVFAKAYDV